jgi:ubiquinone biosynthesis UbiH/UbiF/VisC/COQ6 family hydroxylase
VARHQAGFDQRIFAISPASWDWMRQQGLTAAIDSARVGVIDRMHLEAATWSNAQPIVLDAYRAAVDQLAITVEQSELIAAGQQAVAITGVLRLNDSLSSLQADEGGHQRSRRSIQLENGQQLSAKLLMGCDGSGSKLRKLANIASRRFDYQSSAVVANFESDAHHRHTAFQWFSEQGILALLPLPGQAMSMVWSAPQHVARSLMGLDAAALCRHVQGFIDGQGCDAPGLRACISTPASFPLVEALSDQPFADRLVLIADAAHVIHPMAGQGLNLGIGDIIELLAVLSTASARHDPGALAVIERYVRRRVEAVLAMSWLTKGLHQAFRAPLPGFVSGFASWAWSRLAASSWLQSAMIHHAAGQGPR